MENIYCDFIDKNGDRCQRIGRTDYEGSIRCSLHRTKRLIVGHPKRIAFSLRKKIKSAILSAKICGYYSQDLENAASKFMELAKLFEENTIANSS